MGAGEAMAFTGSYCLIQHKPTAPGLEPKPVPVLNKKKSGLGFRVHNSLLIYPDLLGVQNIRPQYWTTYGGLSESVYERND